MVEGDAEDAVGGIVVGLGVYGMDVTEMCVVD